MTSSFWYFDGFLQFAYPQVISGAKPGSLLLPTVTAPREVLSSGNEFSLLLFFVRYSGNFDSQILCQLARYRLLTRKAVTSGRMATDERSLLSDRLKYLGVRVQSMDIRC